MMRVMGQKMALVSGLLSRPQTKTCSFSLDPLGNLHMQRPLGATEMLKNPAFKPRRTISSKNNHSGFPSLWHFLHMWAACIVELTWIAGGKESGVM